MSKILLLGAGASKGSSLNTHHSPPTTGEFFSHPQAHEVLRLYVPMMDYFQQIGIDALKPPYNDIEVLFDHIESIWELDIYSTKDLLNLYGIPFLAATPVEMVKSYMVDLITLTTRSLLEHSCPYHDYLMREWLSVGDSVISFNYDLIADFSLKRTRNWVEANGYGFYVHIEEEDSPTIPGIVLFKPHGSLNWRMEVDSLTTKGSKSIGFLDKHNERIAVKTLETSMAVGHPAEELGTDLPAFAPGIIHFCETLLEALGPDNPSYSQVADDVKQFDYEKAGNYPLLILPKRNKNYVKMKFGQLGNIWKAIRNNLESCEEVMACGFSFNDLHFNQLLREVCLHRSDKLRIDLINTDVDLLKEVQIILAGCNVEIEQKATTLEHYISISPLSS